MKIFDIFSHRNGQDILESPRFKEAFEELLTVLKELPPYRAAAVKKTSASHIISPPAMNHWLDNELSIRRDWDWHPLIISAEDTEGDEKGSQLRSDFRKSRIEVEVQFGNVARYAYDVYKMAISMALGHSDVGVVVVCTKRFAEITGGNIAYYERAVRELSRSRLTLIVPLVVVGIEPDNWIPETYPHQDQAPKVTAKLINEARKLRGEPPVPLDTEIEDARELRALQYLADRTIA